MIKITSFSYSLGASVCQDSAQPVRVPLSLLDPADLLGNTWPVSGRTKMVQVFEVRVIQAIIMAITITIASQLSTSSLSLKFIIITG